MKRLILLPCLLICVALLATVTALMQDRRPQFIEREMSQTSQAPDVLPQRNLNQNRLHKLVVTKEDDDAYVELMRRNAIRDEINYDSFKVVVVDEDSVGRAALEAMPVAKGDYLDLIY